MQTWQRRQLPKATACPVAVLLCQTTPQHYLHGFPAPEEGSRKAGRFSLPLLLPAGDLPHFPKTAKLFFPPAAVRGKRKGKGCSSWGSGQARVKGCKQREGTCTPGFLFGHNLPLGWSHHPIVVGHKTSGGRLQSFPLQTGPHQLGCRDVRALVWEGTDYPNLTFIISHHP